MNSAKNKDLKKSALIVVSLSVFMIPFMISAINIALPKIQSEFSANAVSLSWVATAYLLASCVMLVPSGKLGDIYGRKKIFSIGIAVFTVFSISAVFAPSLSWLIIFRAFQGMGAAMSMATSMAIISDVFPVNERGKAMGIVVACVYTGLSFGPFAGGWLTEHFGWQSIFLINAFIGIISLYFSIVKVRKEWAVAENERFDIVGSILYGISIICFMYGLTALPALPGIGLLSVGIIGFILFVYYVTKTKFPVIDVYLFRSNKTFTCSSIAALISYSATFAVGFLLSLYLQYIKGMSPQMAGIVLISQPIVQAAFSPLAGRFSDKTEPAKIASAGMSLTAFGLFLLIFLSDKTSLNYIVICLLILGFGFALFSSPNMNAIMSSVEKNSYGIASGTVATMRLIGQMLSLAIVTLIFSITIGCEAISPLNYDVFIRSVKILFIVFTASCLSGIYFSLNRGAIKEA